MLGAQPANNVTAGQPMRGIHDPPRLSLGPACILGASGEAPIGTPQRTVPPLNFLAGSTLQQDASISQLAPAAFPFPNLSVGAFNTRGNAQPTGDTLDSSLASSQTGHGMAAPAPIYPMTSLDARAQGITPGRAPLAGHVSRPVIPASLTGPGGKTSAFEGAFARMLPPSSLMNFAQFPSGTQAHGSQLHSNRRGSPDMLPPSPHLSGGPASGMHTGEQPGATRRSVEISRPGASPGPHQQRPPWGGTEPSAHLAQLSDTVRRAASMGSVLSKATSVLSQQQKRQQQQASASGSGQLPWPPQIFSVQPDQQRHPDAFQMQAEAASLKAQLASLQYPTSFSNGPGQMGAAQPLPSAVLASRYGSQPPQPYSRAAATSTPCYVSSLNNSGQAPRSMARAAATPSPGSMHSFINAEQPPHHEGSAPAVIGSSTAETQQGLHAVRHGSGRLVPGSSSLVQSPLQASSLPLSDDPGNMYERTQEYCRQQAGRACSTQRMPQVILFSAFMTPYTAR